MNKLTLNLLLATSGMLASSVIASAVEAEYTGSDAEGYTFTTSGEIAPGAFNFEDTTGIKGVTLNAGIQVTYSSSNIKPEGILTLNNNTSFGVLGYTDGSANYWDFTGDASLVVNGSANIDAIGGFKFESGSQTTINGHLTIGATGMHSVDFKSGSRIDLNLSAAVGDLAILNILTSTITVTNQEVVLDGATITLSNVGAGDHKLIRVEDKYKEEVGKAGFVLADGTKLTIGENGLAWGESDGSYSTLIYSSTIPEPSAFGLLAGLGALALVVSRRRRARKIA